MVLANQNEHLFEMILEEGKSLILNSVCVDDRMLERGSRIFLRVGNMEARGNFGIYGSFYACKRPPDTQLKRNARTVVYPSERPFSDLKYHRILIVPLLQKAQ